MKRNLQAAIEAAQALLADVRPLRQLAEQPCQRLVFLGSGCRQRHCAGSGAEISGADRRPGAELF